MTQGTLAIRIDRLELIARTLSKQELLTRINIHSGLEQAVFEQELYIREAYNADSNYLETSDSSFEPYGHDIRAWGDDVWGPAATQGMPNRGLYCVR